MPVVAEAGDVKRVLIKRGGIDSARCMEVHPKVASVGNAIGKSVQRVTQMMSHFSVLTKRLTRLRHVIPFRVLTSP